MTVAGNGKVFRQAVEAIKVFSDFFGDMQREINYLFASGERIKIYL